MKFLVSLTTIPSKVNNVHKTLETLFQQTVAPAMVVLHIPKTYTMRFGGQVVADSDRDRLKTQFPSLVIHEVEHDHGPGTKLLGLFSYPGWERGKDDTFIVLVDDDLLYHPCMLEWFEAYKEKHPDMNAASFYVYPVGFLFVGQGADGFMIRAHVLEDFLSYYDRIKDLDYVLYHDDIYLSYYLYLRGVPLYRLHPLSTLYHKHDSSATDALSMLQGKYSRRELNRWVPQILQDVFQSDHEKWSR